MVLQVTFPNGTQHTKGYSEIGKEFSIVEKECAPDEFEELYKKEMGSLGDKYAEDTYAFIIYPGNVRPLYKGQFNYLVSNDGQVFKDLTHR